MMKPVRIFLFLLLAVPPIAQDIAAQDKKPMTLREVLLAELRSTHMEAEWFVPANVAVKGLTSTPVRVGQRDALGRPKFS